MRSRNVVSIVNDQEIYRKNISSSDEEAIKSRGFEVDDDELKKTNIIMIKNPRIILCLGILLGVVLSIFIHHIDTKPIQNVHKSVKHAYRAHNEARKEYLKRYREAYLESILSAASAVASKEEERNTRDDEIISTGSTADIEVDNTITEEEVRPSVVVASTSDKIVFKTLENGKHVCLPLIPEEFSELVVEEGNDVSGTLTSRAECEWFNTLTNVGLEAAKMPSTCVPNNHIFATLTNDHDWEMLEFGLQHVKSEKCFIDRLLVLCLDDKSFIKCKAAKFEHCVEYIKPLGAADFMKDDYRQIVWLKPKMALALLDAKLSLFTLDSDILFFQVPDLAKIVELNPDVELFYQWERVNYTQLYTIPNYNEDYEGNVLHDGYNSGQVLWLPTENVIKGTLFALLNGKIGGAGDGLEQTYTANGMKQAGVKSAGLSFKYAANWACETRGECLVKTNSQNWISYHATWVQGLGRKMIVLKMANEGWLILTTKLANIVDKAVVEDDSNLAKCSAPLKHQGAFGFGNTFLMDDLKQEIDSAEGVPGYRASAWEPREWKSEENYALLWKSVVLSGKLKERLSSELDERCAFETKSENENAEQDKNKIAAIHFRCSDVPIDYAPTYPLAPPEYSSFIGKKYREWGIKRIVPMLCSEHHVGGAEKEKRKEECENLFKLQLNIIKRQLPPDVHIDDIKCLSEVTTLLAMRDMGASTDLVPSSFTFSAGLARQNVDRYIMPHIGIVHLGAAEILVQSKLDENIIGRMRILAENMPMTMFCPRCGNEIADTPPGVEKWDFEVSKPLLEKYTNSGAI